MPIASLTLLASSLLLADHGPQERPEGGRGRRPRRTHQPDAKGGVVKGRRAEWRTRHTEYSEARASVGRVLKPATDATVKEGKRICNYRIFYEGDDALINQPLYVNNYARNASSVVGTWMLVASRSGQLALEAQPAAPLALMAPEQ